MVFYCKNIFRRCRFSKRTLWQVLKRYEHRIELYRFRYKFQRVNVVSVVQMALVSYAVVFADTRPVRIARRSRRLFPAASVNCVTRAMDYCHCWSLLSRKLICRLVGNRSPGNPSAWKYSYVWSVEIFRIVISSITVSNLTIAKFWRSFRTWVYTLAMN